MSRTSLPFDHEPVASWEQRGSTFSEDQLEVFRTLLRIFDRSILWDRRGWDKWAEFHKDLHPEIVRQVRERSGERIAPCLDEYEDLMEEYAFVQGIRKRWWQL